MPSFTAPLLALSFNSAPLRQPLRRRRHPRSRSSRQLPSRARSRSRQQAASRSRLPSRPLLPSHPPRPRSSSKRQQQAGTAPSPSPSPRPLRRRSALPQQLLRRRRRQQQRSRRLLPSLVRQPPWVASGPRQHGPLLASRPVRQLRVLPALVPRTCRPPAAPLQQPQRQRAASQRGRRQLWPVTAVALLRLLPAAAGRSASVTGGAAAARARILKR